MGKQKLRLKRTNIYLTERQIEKLQSLALREKLSVAGMIRRAVDIFLDREERGRCLSVKKRNV